ncbi:MAG: hypothetical protein KF758_08780 [Anaerolineales bacterium]|nr:hypothetical protein [Anaerolineales bacterium]MBX3036994.1 hypothetical protein [Anaerolineales bacterium]
MKTSKKRSQEYITQRKKYARLLFTINAIVWIVIGILFVYEMVIVGNTVSAALVAFFFLINVLVLLACAKLLEQREKWIYFTLIIITLVNIGLTFTGYPEFLYLLSLAFDVLILFNVIPLKKYFFKES